MRSFTLTRFLYSFVIDKDFLRRLPEKDRDPCRKASKERQIREMAAILSAYFTRLVDEPHHQTPYAEKYEMELPVLCDEPVPGFPGQEVFVLCKAEMPKVKLPKPYQLQMRTEPDGTHVIGYEHPADGDMFLASDVIAAIRAAGYEVEE